jgi:hypothetical protein
LTFGASLNAGIVGVLVPAKVTSPSVSLLVTLDETMGRTNRVIILFPLVGNEADRVESA